MWGLWKYIKFPPIIREGKFYVGFTAYSACLLMNLIPKLLGNEASLHVVRYVHVRV